MLDVGEGIGNRHFLPDRGVRRGHFRAPGLCSEDVKRYLGKLVASGVRAICVNPDITIIRDGSLIPAPGAIARIYEELGGRVDYVG